MKDTIPQEAVVVQCPSRLGLWPQPALHRHSDNNVASFLNVEWSSMFAVVVIAAKDIAVSNVVSEPDRSKSARPVQ